MAQGITTVYGSISPMPGFAPKKQFSQNFLTDVSIARNIVRQLDVQNGDMILEVGPGKGALTALLLETPAQSVHAVDVDSRMLAYISEQPWASSDRLHCTLQDALRVSMQEVYPTCERKHRKVIGNIPYSITSELLFWAFSQHAHVSHVVFMMQREVAKRCAAGPGTKDYGILSVASWLYSEPKIAFHVQPGSFFPRPEVTSSVIVFRMRESLPLGLDEGMSFMEFVRAAFSQRRKVLSNALGGWAGRHGCDARSTVLGVDLTRTRAEELTPTQLAETFLALRQQRNPTT